MHHEWRFSGRYPNCENSTSCQNFRLFGSDMEDKAQLCSRDHALQRIRTGRGGGGRHSWEMAVTQTHRFQSLSPHPGSGPQSLPGRPVPGSPVDPLPDGIFLPGKLDILAIKSSPAQSSGGFQTVFLLLNGEVLTTQCRN